MITKVLAVYRMEDGTKKYRRLSIENAGIFLHNMLIDPIPGFVGIEVR